MNNKKLLHRYQQNYRLYRETISDVYKNKYNFNKKLKDTRVYMKKFIKSSKRNLIQ